MFDYTPFVTLAKRQIDRFGRSVSLLSDHGGLYDPTSDQIEGHSETQQTVKALFVNVEKNDIDGSLVLLGDQMVLLAADSLKHRPSTTDKIIDGDRQLTVVAVRVQQSGDTPVLYKLQVRG